MQSVKSGHIAAIGHDPATGEMRIEFKSGKVYRWLDVSTEDHSALMDADSLGSHLHHNFGRGTPVEE